MEKLSIASPPAEKRRKEKSKKIRGEEMRGVGRRGEPASGDCETSQHSDGQPLLLKEG